MNDITNQSDGAPLMNQGAGSDMSQLAAGASVAVVQPGDEVYRKHDRFYEQGVGSEVFMPTFTDSFSVPEGGACAQLSLEVDDWGKIALCGPAGSFVLDMMPDAPGVTPGVHGGHERWKVSRSFELPQGDYSVEVSHQNVDMPLNQYNDSFCEYHILVTALGVSGGSGFPSDSEVDGFPAEEKDKKDVHVCQACSCSGEDGDWQEEQKISPTEAAADFCRSSATPGLKSAAALLAAKRQPVVASAVGDAVSQAAPVEFGFTYESVWVWRASLQGEIITIAPPSGQALYFRVQEGCSVALPAGPSRRRDFRVLLQAADASPCSSPAEAAFLLLADSSGQRVRFAVESGAVVSVTSAAGKLLTAEERAEGLMTVFDADGHLAASFSAAEGLMLVEDAEPGAKLVSWYEPSQVTLREDGSFATQGEPYKTVLYRISDSNGVRTSTVTRQQRGLPAHTVTRTVDGNCVTITKGEGDDAIIRAYESNSLPDNMQEIIETVRGARDARPLSCSREVRRLTDAGWLTVSRTEAFNTPLARTTTYEYNEQFHLSRVDRPDGGFTTYEYDAENRVTVETEPWADGGTKRTRYEYAAASDRFYDTRPVKVYTDYQMKDGDFLNLKVVDYSYETSPEVERTVTSTCAAGVDYQQVSIEETYGEAAAYPYAAGKTKFSQAVNGVQTLHSYEATAEHGAVHLHTTITQAHDALVAGQSRKTEEFIAANDTTTFSQESIWDGSQWLLLSTAAYEYDAEQRLVKTTRGNGRSSTTEWMCCGALREVDEDGILTTHAYNTAHQRLGTTRSAVMDGDTEITPESLSEITPDALGRAIASRREIGPMLTVEHTEYDSLGRVVKQTDALGRVTSTEYSADGLTTAITTPTGATRITTRFIDGSTASVSGTGQRELLYEYDIVANCLRTTVKNAAGDILSQSLTDGFGQTVVESAPSTTGYIHTRSEFDAKGQLVKQYQDAGADSAPSAPTLYEYDAMGNPVRETLALCDSPSKDNSPVQETAYSVELLEDGVYSVTSSTRYNAQGEPLTSTQKQLISQLSATLESKSISVDERGHVTTAWAEFGAASERRSFVISPTSNIMAASRRVDGFTLTQTDHQGITTTASRHYGKGITQTYTDGRGNTTTTVTDIIGRTVSVTDSAGNVTTTEYHADSDLPAKVTDALGNTTCYAYDARGRKTAEWGTAIQPACFGYDEADRMTSLTTFRAGTVTISSDPSNRTDGDTTTWEYHDATGLEIRKTYADGSQVVKTYDAFNRLETETDARGVVKSHSYEPMRSLLLSTSYSDGTTPRRFAYNHLGQLTQVSDDAGARTLSYNAYGEKEVDELLADGITHTITELQDEFGRSTGYSYAKNGAAQQTVTTGYAADGRIASAGFLHEGEMKRFEYSYLPGSNLLEALTHPNGITLTQSYEPQRDLLTQLCYSRGDELQARRSYTYDALGRPTERSVERNGATVHDSFTHNSRSELISAQVNNELYGYDYDNIGNRRMSIEGSQAAIYEANALNQYTSIADGPAPFTPEFDPAGNQTLVKTATGIWRISYNAENRPTTFTSEDGFTMVQCSYDHMGRRSYKKVTTNGAVTLHQRYIYRGYLQIAACDLTRTGHPCLWLILWDPTQPTATRPLAITKDNEWHTYAWDLTKNICELYGPTGYIRTLYTYTPYGSVTSEGDVTQPIQWSSEFHDTELGLVYYNYRHYNPFLGRWISRDIMQERAALNSYIFTTPLLSADILGAWADGSVSWSDSLLYGKGHSDFPGQTPNGPFDYTLEDKGDTSPLNPTATWRHFRPLVDSERELAKYTKTCNKKEYESRAHQMQDYFSHYGQGFRANKYNHTTIEVLIRFLGLFEEDTVYNFFPKMETLTILSNYPLGHALASAKGIRPGMPLPDNSLHYEAAYEQARERTQKWLNQWNICCCQENGRWIPKKNIQTGKSECENFTGFLDSATVKALPPNLSTVYTPSKINTPVQLKGVVWEDTH